MEQDVFNQRRIEAENRADYEWAECMNLGDRIRRDLDLPVKLGEWCVGLAQALYQAGLTWDDLSVDQRKAFGDTICRMAVQALPMHYMGSGVSA